MSLAEATVLPQTVFSATGPTPCDEPQFLAPVDADGTQPVRHRRSIGATGGDIDALAAGFEMFGLTTAGQNAA